PRPAGRRGRGRRGAGRRRHPRRRPDRRGRLRARRAGRSGARRGRGLHAGPRAAGRLALLLVHHGASPAGGGHRPPVGGPRGDAAAGRRRRRRGRARRRLGRGRRGVGLGGVAADLPGGVRVVRRHLALGWRYTVEAAIVTSTTQVSVLVVGVAVGAAGVGAIRGGTTLFGPFTVLFLALMSGGIAEGSRLLARAPHRLVPVLVGASLGMAALPCAWAVALLVMPDGWGPQVLGDTWEPARALVVPLMAKTAATGAASGALIGLRVVAAARATLRLRLVTGVATLAAGAVGAGVAGVSGAGWGLALGTWATALSAWWQLARVPVAQPGPFAGGRDDREGTGS